MKKSDAVTIEPHFNQIQAANFLGLTQARVWQFIHEGRLPVVDFYGAKLIPRTALETFSKQPRVRTGRPRSKFNNKGFIDLGCLSIMSSICGDVALSRRELELLLGIGVMDALEAARQPEHDPILSEVEPVGRLNRAGRLHFTDLGDTDLDALPTQNNFFTDAAGRPILERPEPRPPVASLCAPERMILEHWEHYLHAPHPQN